MLNSSFIFYHYWRKFVVSQNGEDGTGYTCLPEMQKVFSNCSMESDDKIRSSIFIEAITLAYGLNEELKTKLETKLDPNNLDLLYSKDELFLIFKDWISSGQSMEKSPTNLSCFSSFKFPQSSTPTCFLGSARRRIPRMRLFLPDDALFGSDEADIDTSRSSSSTKKRLSYHRSILESKLETFEKHTSSLEKKYEDINNICAQQKLEIERLKQELKTHHETEQAMEEMSEERRVQELETELKYNKTQVELCAALAERTNLITEMVSLKQDYNQLLQQIQFYEKEVANEREKKSNLQIELECLCGELKNEVTILNNQKAEQDAAFAMILEENSILMNEINDLRNKITSNFSPITSLGGGVPLCEELPSEMFQFIMDDDQSQSCGISIEQVNELPELMSRSCQTENEIQSELSIKELAVPLVLSQNKKSVEENSNNYIRPNCSQIHTNDTVQFQPDLYCLQVQDNRSQTELCLCKSSSKANWFLVSASCQTDPFDIFSILAQNDSRTFNSVSCQTESLANISTYSQTSRKQTLSSLVQTDISNAQTQENFAQTERFELLSSASQTDGSVSASISTQTDIFEMVTVGYQTETPSISFNWSQTLTSLTDSTYCQTELPKVSSQQTEPIETVFNSSQTESISLFCQTEKHSELPSSFSQTDVFNILSRSSQTDVSPSAFSSPKNHGLKVLNYLPQICSNTDVGSSQLFDYVFLFRTIFGLVLLLISYLPSKKRVGRCLSSFFYQTVLTICSLLVALFAIFFVYVVICQNNRCQLDLRYPNGNPPV